MEKFYEKLLIANKNNLDEILNKISEDGGYFLTHSNGEVEVRYNRYVKIIFNIKKLYRDIQIEKILA